MAEASVPVDLTNPGQVFACLGLLEAADVLCGEAMGGFDWSAETDTRFRLSAAGDDNPVAGVLAFLAKVKVVALAPEGWRPKKEPEKEKARQKLGKELSQQKKVGTFPAPNPESSAAMPIELSDDSGKTKLFSVIGRMVRTATISNCIRAIVPRSTSPRRCCPEHENVRERDRIWVIWRRKD